MHFLTTVDAAEQAEALCDVLLGQGIGVAMRPGDHGIGIWILEQDDVDRATATLERFREDPDAAPLRAAAEVGRKRREEHLRRHQPTGIAAVLRAPVALFSIAVSLLVYVLSHPDLMHPGAIDGAVLDPLWIATDADMDAGAPLRSLQREPWRLFTPIFIHFDLIHIGFNTLVMWRLGGIAERIFGSPLMAALCVVSAGASNLAQLLLGGSHRFGGMSGVAYAVIGFVWLRGRFDPQSPVRLPGDMVVAALAWLAMGFTGMLNMANYAHLGGLVVGCAFGVLSAGRQRPDAA